MRKVEDDGTVRPAAMFMPAVEKLGLVRLVDRKALELAVETIQSYPHVGLAINVSGLTATDRSWLRGLVAVLRGKSHVAERLTIEITETAVLEDLDDCARFVLSLKDLGCRVALDDFGAGYTSIAQLKTLAVDMIKIDGSFVRDLVTSPHNLVFVRTILELARNLDLKTVAECVESEEAAELLTREGVDYMQGYVFGRPSLEYPWVPADVRHRAAKAG
jgi:EAL domain-containing protein (putative c-di-GMP-specific phosphodiesterase class I)